MTHPLCSARILSCVKRELYISNQVVSSVDHQVDQWLPTFFFHLRTPWRAISINCALHINKMFIINIVGFISNLRFNFMGVELIADIEGGT
jgi:hypothetical protein